ncbi:MAG: endo-1,4-beta-xylanase [Chloroflexi bacterium]|nr:endo-1,4-beta-xylanase [Chloroflexota bacterium]
MTTTVKVSRCCSALYTCLISSIILAAAAPVQAAKPPSLKDAYRHHFYVGAAINRSVATGKAPRFGFRTAEQVQKDIALTEEQFNQISPENDLKFASIQPREGPDGYDFGPADAYVAFGLKHHMVIVGHTLVWYGQNPRWLFAGTTPPAAGAPGNPPDAPGNPLAPPANASGPPENVPTSPANLPGPPGNPPGPPAGGPGPPRVGAPRNFGGGRFGPGFIMNGPHASREQLLQRMRDHIQTVVGRYRGKIKIWDVVNESVSDGGPNILRNSPWLQIIGPDYVARAFEYAHEADPHAILRLNDYGLEYPAKRQKFIALVKQLQAEKVPVMAIGTQTHISVTSPSPEAIDQELTDLESLNLPIHITEFDVNGARGGQRVNGADIDNNAAATEGGLISDADQRLADQYANLFKVFLKHKSVKVVTFWGVNDGVSWLANGKPLLFDGDDQPKPAFFAVIGAAKGNQRAARE